LQYHVTFLLSFAKQGTATQLVGYHFRHSGHGTLYHITAIIGKSARTKDFNFFYFFYFLQKLCLSQ